MRITKDTTTHIGERYGRLIIQEYSHFKQYSQTRMYYYKCLCDCGKNSTVSIEGLKRGRTRSCGCLSKELRSLPTGKAAENKVIMGYKANAKIRNYSFELKDDELISLFKQDCYYCGASPTNTANTGYDTGSFIYNGIDRIDNSLGYERNNCVSCCKICNIAKHTMSTDEFISWVKRVYLKSCAD